MIYIIHKMLVLVKNRLNYLKDKAYRRKYKDIRNLFRLKKKEINYTAVNDTRNLFRLEKEKEIKAIKEYLEILRIFLSMKMKSYYKPASISDLWSNIFIEYESNDDINKALSVEEYLSKVRPYLDIINNFEKSDMWKIQLTIANNFIYSKDNDKEHVMHSKT